MKVFKMGLVPLWYKIKARYLTKDAEMDNIASTKGAYEYLKKYRQKVEKVDASEDNDEPVRYWTCWLQGEENAPKIVQVCLKSMRKYLGEEHLTLLTSENIKDYVQVPDYIKNKLKRGIISRTHYSDVVRLLLLEQYGGIWIDSTILMTGAMPEIITKSNFFVYRQAEHGKIKAASNFMVAKPHNPIVRYTLGMISDYWEKEDRMVSYSLIHLAMTHASEAYPKLWNDIPYIPGELEYLMNYRFNDDYTEEGFKKLCDMTPIHKLTYKTEQFKIDTKKKGSFYDFVCNDLYFL